jgi:hypothetical protein
MYEDMAIDIARAAAAAAKVMVRRASDAIARAKCVLNCNTGLTELANPPATTNIAKLTMPEIVGLLRVHFKYTGKVGKNKPELVAQIAHYLVGLVGGGGGEGEGEGEGGGGLEPEAVADVDMFT